MLQKMKKAFRKTKTSKKLIILLCLLFVSVFGISTTYSYVVSKTPTLFNLFLNGLNPDGNLIIEKMVEHPFEDSYQIPEDLKFDFKIELGSTYANEMFKTSLGEKKTDEKGNLYIQIGSNDRATIYDIDDEVIVNIEEINIMEGFTPDNVKQSVTIQKYKDNAVSFVNTYLPQKADTSSLQVTGVKNLSGREWIEGDTFTFALEVKEEDWKPLATQKIMYTENGSADFNTFDFTEVISNYTFDKVGIYSFKVYEKAGSIGGLTYDTTESYFDVLIEDLDMDGYLEIQEITTNTANTEIDNQHVHISFENKYAPIGSAEVLIEINKEIEDTSGQNFSKAGYTFELYDEHNSKIITSSPTKESGETSIRLVVEPKDAGKTFRYYLKETHDGEMVGAMKYDDKEYKLHVTVIDNLDGSVSAFVYEQSQSISIDTTNIFKATFTNRYDPEDANIRIQGNKKLSGREMNDGEFTFLLYESNAQFSLNENDTPIDIQKNINDVFTFETIQFQKVGTYYYVVKEEETNTSNGVKCDKSKYYITVQVKDMDGELKATTIIQNEYGEESAILFENEYIAKPVSLAIEGKKLLSGAKIQDYTFTFDLYVADETFKTKENVFKSEENDQVGYFKFEDLEFTKPGTYYYVVKERSSEINGITFDDKTYGLIVVVKDNGKGQLEIQDYTIKVGNEKAETIVFENTYKAPPPTNDSSNRMMWEICMMLSILVLICSYYRRKNEILKNCRL